MYSNTSFMLFGLIGVLVTRLLLKPDLSMDVAYDELKTISRGKILMNRNVLDLETSQGEKFRMMVKLGSMVSRIAKCTDRRGL